MDQLKTFKSNFKINFDSFSSWKNSAKYFKEYSIVKVVVFYVMVGKIHILQFHQVADDISIDFDLTVKIGDTLADSLSAGIKQLKKHKKYSPKAKICMVLDDYYLSMYRFNFNKSQMKNFHQSIEMEIDNLNEFDWEYTIGFKEVKDFTTILIFSMKKKQLKALETVFKKEKLFLRRIVSRYHVVMKLFRDNAYVFPNNGPFIFLDISPSRVRVIFIVNNEIKMYRRMSIKPLDGTKKDSSFDSVLKLSTSFIESCMDSYLVRYSNQEFKSIYVYSDIVSIPKQLKKYSIKGVPIQHPTFSSDFYTKQKIDCVSSFPYIFSAFKQLRHFRGFNLIPLIKRFEKFFIFTILSVFSVIFFLMVFSTSSEYFSLKKELKTYSGNLKDKAGDQQKRKAEIIDKRDRAKKQKKIMDYAELTTVAYSSQIPINDLLMKLSRIFSNDMSFNSLRIRRNQVNLSGTCSSLNGNYSFYTFLQKLQSISYLDKPRYSLSLAPGVNVSKFSVQIDWRKSE